MLTNSEPKIKWRSNSCSVILGASLFALALVAVIFSVGWVLPGPMKDFETLLSMQRIGKFIPARAGATLLGMVAIVSVVHDELYRKIFLATVTDADLDRLARIALPEKQAAYK